MKIDILMPSYKSPHPLVRDAIQVMTDYSRCKCAYDTVGEAYRMLNKSPGEVYGAIKRTIHDPSQCPFGKHDIWTPPIAQSCVIHWVRNGLLMSARPDFDYVLFCDDDIIPAKDSLDRLLSHGQDIVAGLCTKRTDPPEPNMRQWVEERQNYGTLLRWPDHGKLIQVDAVGTGLMLISRKVVEEMAVAFHPDLVNDDQDLVLPENAHRPNGWWFKFLENAQGGEWGEDISFCWKAQKMGYKIYVDTAVCPGHCGDYFYGIEDFLAYQKDRIAGKVGLSEKEKEQRTMTPAEVWK